MAKIKGATLTFEVTDDGSLKLLEGKTKKTKKAVDDLSRSEQTLNRNFKGASQQSSNTTKNFSKMAQGITGGLVPAYATLAANVFAITAAFRFFQDAANFRILTEGAAEYATITGEALSLITSRLQEATGGQLAFAEAAQSVAIARAAGVTSDQLERIGLVAKNASIALGRDLTDSLNRLIRGVTKAEPELLDELGIILRLEVATKKYAEEMGIAGRKLSIFEKSQAVVNEVLEQGEEKFGEFNTELNSFSLLAKSFDDLLNRIKRSLSGVAEFIAGALSNNVTALAGAFALLGTGIASAIAPQAPQIDFAAVRESARTDIGKFFTPTSGREKARLDRFQSGTFTGKDITQLQRSVNAKKSSVLNFENFTRREANKTLTILKGYNIELEASTKGAFARGFASARASMLFFQAEYGKFVGFIKFLGSKLAKALSLIGYVGILLTVIGLLREFAQRFRDPDIVAAEKRIKAINDRFQEQLDVLSQLNKDLKQTNTLFAGIQQQAKFFENFSFKGLTDIVREFNQNEQLQKAALASIGVDTSPTAGAAIPIPSAVPETTATVDSAAIEKVIKTLEIQQSKLVKTGSFYADVTKRIDLFTKALDEQNEFGGLTSDTFDELVEGLTDLETKGTKAQQAFTGFGIATRKLTDATQKFSSALSNLRKGSTPLTQITESIAEFGQTLFDTGELDISQFKDLVDAQFDTVIDKATKEALQTFIGDDAFDRITAQAGVRTSGGRALSAEAIAKRDLGIIKELGAAALAEAERLREIEIAHMTGKTKLQTEFLEKQTMVGPLTSANIKKEEKLALLSLERTQKEEMINELRKKGLEDNDVFMQKANAELDQLDVKIEQAKDALDLVKQVNEVAIDSLESNLATALQAIITGAKSAKEAFADMAKAILNSIAQILAQQAAMAIMGILPFGGAGGRSGGIMSAPGYRSFSMGGVASGPNSGYPAVLHGTEAVVPLPNGRSIPVEMSGGAGVNNINVNVNMTTGQVDSESDNAEMIGIGKAIAEAVKNEIEVQQRPGGSLSLY
tara:strand:- start:5149 stop:8235 length:3087 start_codon:yes stop_codon:yes gene_type:complete